MIFPELVERVKGFFDGFGGTPTLGLKSGGFGLDWYARNGFNGIFSAMSGGMPAWSGESVTIDTSLNHSVVWACNRVISESVAFLPLVMMQEKAGTKRAADEHPMYSALHNAPNDEMTAMGFRETRTSNCVLQGNGYAQIIRRSGTGIAIELQPLNPGQVNEDRNARKQLVYVIKESGAADKTYTVESGKPHPILHIRGLGWDGIRGYSVIAMARQSIGTALSAERNVGRFYANGGRVPYHLEMASKFKTDEDFKQFTERWGSVYSEPHKVPVLENGIAYKQDGLSMADSQMLETRQFSIPEICRWFAVSPHMVGDLSRATFSNIEQLALEFVKFTLSAWLSRWEQELWRCVLTPEEKSQGYFFKHNLNALLRGDFVSRMAGYASALQNGHLNQDEVRNYEDLNPLPDGEGSHYRVQLNMQALTANGQPDPAAAELAARAKKERIQ